MGVPRKRIDAQYKFDGWTHRWKGKSSRPYLKEWTRNEPHGAIYTDMEKQFRYLADDKVVTL